MSTAFSSNVDALFNKMEDFVTSKTVVGEPIYLGGTILLPMMDVSFGMGAGAFGSERAEAQPPKEGGGGGIGAKMTPSAVLVIQGDHVQLVNVKNQDSINKLIDMAPGLLSKLNLNLFGKKAEEEVETTEADPGEGI